MKRTKKISFIFVALNLFSWAAYGQESSGGADSVRTLSQTERASLFRNLKIQVAHDDSNVTGNTAENPAVTAFLTGSFSNACDTAGRPQIVHNQSGGGLSTDFESDEHYIQAVSDKVAAFAIKANQTWIDCMSALTPEQRACGAGQKCTRVSTLDKSRISLKSVNKNVVACIVAVNPNADGDEILERSNEACALDSEGQLFRHLTQMELDQQRRINQEREREARIAELTKNVNECHDLGNARLLADLTNNAEIYEETLARVCFNEAKIIYTKIRPNLTNANLAEIKDWTSKCAPAQDEKRRANLNEMLEKLVSVQISADGDTDLTDEAGEIDLTDLNKAQLDKLADTIAEAKSLAGSALSPELDEAFDTLTAKKMPLARLAQIAKTSGPRAAGKFNKIANKLQRTYARKCDERHYEKNADLCSQLEEQMDSLDEAYERGISEYAEGVQIKQLRTAERQLNRSCRLQRMGCQELQQVKQSLEQIQNQGVSNNNMIGMPGAGLNGLPNISGAQSASPYGIAGVGAPPAGLLNLGATPNMSNNMMSGIPGISSYQNTQGPQALAGQYGRNWGGQ